MKIRRIFPCFGTGLFTVVLIVAGLFVSLPLSAQAIIIDHTCTDYTKIPSSWINAAKSNLRCSYGHTSHGSQLITGLSAIENHPGNGTLYNFTASGGISAGVLSIADYTPSGDLGNPDRTEWEARTRTYLNGSGSNRNVVMWSWCGQVSSASSADIETYLNLMDGLEQDFPGVTFVYMTGHLDGSGAGGNLHTRNEQIRAFCLANNKVLFDFADIESYNPSGSYFLNLGADDGCNYSGGNWADEWLAANPGSHQAELANNYGSCAHSRQLNCVLKGGAAWWLFARIAGWNGVVSNTPTLTIASPNGGENWEAGSSHNITWGSTGTVGNVTIQYSVNNGTSWTTITSSTANDGSYPWTVPSAASAQCLVQVSETDGSPSDLSNSVFTISEAGQSPTLVLKSPNGGEVWASGSKHTIEWTTTGTLGDVKLAYSYDNGATWKIIALVASQSGYFTWNVPNTPSTKCLFKIYEYGGTISDTSDDTFTISGSATQQDALTLSIPNGGEQWLAGASYFIRWSSTGTISNVKIQYSVDNGKSWSTIIESTANSGKYPWTVPNVASTQCKIRIKDALDGNPYDISDSCFSIGTQGTATTIGLNRTKLNFGATTGGVITGKQKVMVDVGGGSWKWTASTGTSWLKLYCSSCQGDGVFKVQAEAGDLPAGSYTGSVMVSCADADNSPLTVNVYLKIYDSGSTTVPFGQFEAPENNTTVSSSIPVTGWVLDDIEVKRVKIFNGEKYIGDATLVEGARPDVEKQYPDMPKNYAAGWGYMLLTYGLPRRGAGSYTIYAKALDAEGNLTTLGWKTITVDNTNVVKPFGAIETPCQGGVAAGNKFMNWGWALTPKPNRIPSDGKTITVYVDGKKIGSPVYNIFRKDIAALFPEYMNCKGAIGYFYLDTTAFSNGVHTIQWNAVDNKGNMDGIGSRFFIVENGDEQERQEMSERNSKREHLNQHAALVRPEDYMRVPVDYFGPMQVKMGLDFKGEFNAVYPDESGVRYIDMEELGLLEVRINSGGNKELSGETGQSGFRCFLEAGGQLRPLPIGATFDSKEGILYWQPGPGFIGRFNFVVLEQNFRGEMLRKNLVITIIPKGRKENLSDKRRLER